MVDLPEPVLPMMAVVRPGVTRNEMPDKTGLVAPGYVKPTPSKSTVPRSITAVIGNVGGMTDESVLSTSVIRSAATAARGIIDTMNVSITTATNTWTR